jgi:predicted alpha/beta-hydrolase family hydrolase
MEMTEHSVAWREDRSVGVTVRAAGEPVLVFAHGAGTDRTHPLVAGLADAVAGAGITVVTFDYPYRASGRRWPPDRVGILLECHRAVLEWVRETLGVQAPVVGGRSMGGRMASVLASEGEPCSGLVCHAYPLHPAKAPDRLRSSHLGSIGVPMLFVRGTADALATDGPLDREIRTLPQATVVDLPGADHSFDGGPGGRDAAVSLAADATVRFVRRL